MLIDRWVAAILAPLALWVLLNGIDDLIVDAAWLLGRLRSRRYPMPADAQLDALPQRRMAIFVPLWQEHRVIQSMVEHNVTAQKYRNYDFFIGCYPNDALTVAAVKEVVKRFPNAHLSLCPHEGPTSKADCLNWIYQRMLLFEEETGARFETILTHDAEDLVHPEALRWINYYAQWNDMVQIPVLALPTPRGELTHGVYCDDFAEFQFRDMPARQFLGGFLPSNGVGTGFSRYALEKLAAAHANRIFEPRCLTEDYEIGFRIYKLGCSQVCVPIHRHNGTLVATREYFPRVFREAVRQRTRWVTGIGLQSWEMHGAAETLEQLYWFWRDRKSIVSNLVTPMTNVIFLYGAATWVVETAFRIPWGLNAVAHAGWLIPVYGFTLGLQALHMSVRTWCSAQVYGWRFASWAPIRIIWGNWINFLATGAAIHRYATARIQGRPLVWLKTAHAYPHRTALVEHRLKLGQVLVGSGYVEAADLAEALRTQPEGVRIGEWLVQLGKLSVDHLYEALALQANVPLGAPAAAEVSVAVTRTLPAKVSREFQMLPFRVAAGHLYVAGTDFPDPIITKRLRQFCRLEIRFHLITPTEFEAMAEAYLPSGNDQGVTAAANLASRSSSTSPVGSRPC